VLDKRPDLQYWWPRFQAHDVLLRQPAIRRHPQSSPAVRLLGMYCRQNVQERRLCRRRFHPRSEWLILAFTAATALPSFSRRCCSTSPTGWRQRAGAETANRHRRSVQRQWRNDGVHARAIGQARIHHRRRFINSAADARTMRSIICNRCRSSRRSCSPSAAGRPFQ